MGDRAARGELLGWLAGTVLGCLLVLLAAGQAWVRVLAETDVAAPAGGDLAPALTPLALAGLAGVVAALATKGLGRRLVGLLLALCGAGVVAATWTARDAGDITGWLRERSVLQSVGGPLWESLPLWPVVSTAGAVLMVAGGVLAIVRGGRWAGMSARYDRDGGRPAGAAAKAEDDRALWDALDRGDDPTDHR